MSSIPILTTVAEVRKWRQLQFDQNKDVGFVPTMGALHDGHLSLVRASTEQNPSTIVSIFVNPSQFAPSEDLSTYPRTFKSDSALLSSLPTPPSAIFLPDVETIYPGGIVQEKEKQRGAFVEVSGLQDEMEGKSRKTFFRGVATVVTKLFNIVQPTRAYFGQKDIQQCLLLRRLLTDLHTPHPLSHNLIILPTHRDANTGLALSSRNAYLTAEERRWSDVLVGGLREGERVWKEERKLGNGEVAISKILRAAREHVERISAKAKKDGVDLELIYISLNDPRELWELERVGSGVVKSGDGAVLSGAVRLGKTRLIDNFVLDWELNPALGSGA